MGVVAQPARRGRLLTAALVLSAGAAAARFPDIARQLLDFNLRETTMNGIRSKGLEVAMGGGRENFLPASDADPEDANSKGKRKDGRNLAKEWEKTGGKYVWDLAGFHAIDPAKTGPVPYRLSLVRKRS